MNVVNCSGEPQSVFYRKPLLLEPGEVIQINPFDLSDLKDIIRCVQQGIFTVYEDEEDNLDEERQEYYPGKKVNKEGSVFQNINFDNDIDDF